MAKSNFSGKSRARPFEKGNSGNPGGRPIGSRNRTTLAVQALLDNEAESLTRKVIELALNGDLNALRLCLDRLMPPTRGRPVQFDISDLSSIHDAKDAIATTVAAVAAGHITPSEATEIGRLIELYVKVSDASDRAREIEALEAMTTLDASDPIPEWSLANPKKNTDN